MAYTLSEAVDVSAVRVWKSKQSAALPPPHECDHHGAGGVISEQGQFVFVTTFIRPPCYSHMICRKEGHKLRTAEVTALDFDQATLLFPYELALSYLLHTGHFFVNNCELLAREISKILLTRFQFTTATLSGRTPIKVVVHIERKRDVTYTPEAVFAPSQSTTFASEEEEDQTRYTNTEDHDQFMYDDDDREEEITRSDLEDGFMNDDERKGYSECFALIERVKASDDDDHEISEAFGGVEEDRCAICLDGFFVSGKKYVAKTRCGHVFHESCLNGWLPKCGTCPMCRSICVAIV